MNEFTGETDGTGLHVAVIASRYNDFITGRLVEEAVNCFRENGVKEEDIDIFWCPGALEIPALAARVARHGMKGKYYDALVTCGCVIKGETDHYQFVAGEAMRGISELALEANVAVGNAVLTVHDVRQAQARSGERSLNKGWEAAMAALEMANQYKRAK